MIVHLVDGTFELFRAYYGGPKRTNAAGEEIGASRTFARSMKGWIERAGITHIAFAFDHTIESFRNQLFAGYKTGEGIDAELLAQFPLVEQAAAALGAVVWPMTEFETDDALATGAALCAADARVERVIICSPDKDFAQCVVDDRVVMWDRIRDRIYDRAGVIEKWGVEPGAIPDYLALVGDTADGIPGLPGWGAKSAAAVLARYGKLEAIPDAAESWDLSVRGGARLAQTLRERRDDAILYRTLATLRLDVPLAEAVDDLIWTGVEEASWSALAARLEL